METPPAQAPASIATADWLTAHATQCVFKCLNQNGHIARAVGGCVRNSLLAQLSPHGQTSASEIGTTDIDIATTATPDNTMQLAAASNIKVVPTGLQHGTVTLVIEGNSFEVTTLRRDVTTDGRHAEVEFTDNWALDAARRDLTINALYADSDGSIFDPLGGYNDLIARKIRFVGNPIRRIQEDYLRILRFFRFYAQYGEGPIDAAGLHASISERAGLSRLSAERIRQELVKLLVTPRAAATLHTMAIHGILTAVLGIAPNLTRMARMVAIDHAGDASLRLAALTMHTHTDAKKLSDRLRLSKDETAVLRLIGHTLDNCPKAHPNTKNARRWLYQHGTEAYDRLIKFRQALETSEELRNEWAELICLPQNWPVPVFPLSGGILIELGAAPGPSLGKLLAQLEHIWIESDFSLSVSELTERAVKSLN